MVKIYAPAEYATQVKQNAGKITIAGDLKIQCFPHGVIYPDFMNEGFGAFDADLNYIPESRCMRGDDVVPRHITKPRRRDIVECDCDAVYCGFGLFHHFGHFLLEGMNRLYPFLDEKYKNAKFVFVPSRKINSVPRFVMEMLGLFGIAEENVVILDKPTRFRNVYMPDQGYNLYKTTSAQQRAVWQTVAKNAGRPGRDKKIYMSRTAMGKRKTYGEEVVQNIFAKNGYRIVCPETLPLAEQISCVAGATHLAGLAGTALHLAVFMKPGGRVIQIKRNTRISTDEKDDSAIAQEVVNQTSGADFTLIWGSTERKPTGHWVLAPQIVGVTRWMKKFFDDEGFKYNTADLRPDTAETAEYERLLAKSARVQDNGFRRVVAKILARAICMFVPGRHRRTEIRHWFERCFGLR